MIINCHQSFRISLIVWGGPLLALWNRGFFNLRGARHHLQVSSRKMGLLMGRSKMEVADTSLLEVMVSTSPSGKFPIECSS